MKRDVNVRRPRVAGAGPELLLRFDPGNLLEGRTFSKKFTSIGKYDYFCKIHSFMNGSITVVQPYGGG